MTPKQEPQILKTRIELCKIIEGWKADSKRIALVPTMGALHEGHLSLVDIVRSQADKIVAYIFINPTQFAAGEDFETYPRAPEADIQKLQEAGVDLIYLPDEKEIYPDGPEASITAGPSAEGLEGDFRPGHFDGVVTVVREFFDHVQPDIAIFGEKDYQQLCVIREMVEEFKLPIEIIGAPIIRDEEGLALSSRNRYLSEKQLKTARLLNKILFVLAGEIADYPNEVHDLIPAGIQSLLEAGFDEIDYLEMRWGRLLAAARLGKTRLIDNVEI